jgi:hypothetical protein
MGDDPQLLDRDDPAQSLDLDLRVDDEPVRRPAEEAQAPGVRLQPALANAIPIEDIVQRHDQRATVGTPEARQAREGAPAGAPAASIPLEQDDLRGPELAPHLGEPLRLLVDAPSVSLDDGQAVDRRGFVGDELPVAADPALRAAEVQEPDAFEPARQDQSVYPSRRSSSPASASMSAISEG